MQQKRLNTEFLLKFVQSVCHIFCVPVGTLARCVRSGASNLSILTFLFRTARLVCRITRIYSEQAAMSYTQARHLSATQLEIISSLYKFVFFCPIRIYTTFCHISSAVIWYCMKCLLETAYLAVLFLLLGVRC